MSGDAKRHQSFGERPLRREELDPEPLAQCRRWLEDAIEGCEPDPYALTLATIGEEGGPSARIVALKEIDSRGFLFTCHYDGPKARELEADPRAALVLYWPGLHRQVRALGRAERVPHEESRALFEARPRASRLALHVGRPSEPISTRRVLEERLAAVARQYESRDVPMPEWGGYVVRPSIVELWQGHTGRLHDRFRYQLGPEGTWRLQRLAP